MKSLIVICSALMLASCAEQPTLQDFNIASENLALQRLDRACGALSRAVPAARERISEVPPADRSVQEILQLQSERDRGEQLCGPQADPIYIVEIDQITKRVNAIDGKVDQ